MVTILHQAAERGMATGLLFEASVALGNGRFLITEGQCAFNQLEEQQLFVASHETHWLDSAGILPRHLAWHRLIYQQTTAQAVLFSQPVAATALAAQQTLPLDSVLCEAADTVGHIAIAQPEDLSAAVQTAQVLLLPGYGVLTQGQELSEALARMETVNRWCEITITAQNLRVCPEIT